MQILLKDAQSCESPLEDMAIVVDINLIEKKQF